MVSPIVTMMAKQSIFSKSLPSRLQGGQRFADGAAFFGGYKVIRYDGHIESARI